MNIGLSFAEEAGEGLIWSCSAPSGVPKEKGLLEPEDGGKRRPEEGAD